MEPRNVYRPDEAARKVGISASGLRRLAGIYETIFGELPREHGRARVYTEEAVDRLTAARRAVEEGRAVSTEAALRAGEGPDGAAGYYPVPRGPIEANLAPLLEELRNLRAAVEHQNRLLEEQGRRLEALEAPTPAQEPRGSSLSASDVEGSGTVPPETGSERRSEQSWWRRFFGFE